LLDIEIKLVFFKTFIDITKHSIIHEGYKVDILANSSILPLSTRKI